MGRLTDDITRLVGEIKAGHAERVSFIKDMCQEVKSLRQEVAADLEGARRAWFGPSPAERRAQVEAERRAREEAERERRAEEEAERRAREEAERERRAQEEAERLRAAAAKEAKGTEPEPKGPATKKGQAKIWKGPAKKK